MKNCAICGKRKQSDRIGLLLFLLLFNFSGGALAQQAINDQQAVTIGGINQWMNFKGSNDHNPVLLFLHGGPGNSAMRYADKFTAELQKHFVVVQWDQRESGKTAKLNASTEPLTVGRMETDVIEVIDYLRKRFSKDKIYLMGHSWGGFLALYTAATHPEFLEACLAISPMVYQSESERLTLQMMQDDAKTSSDKTMMDELSKVKIPFQNGEQLYFHRKWLAKKMHSPAPVKTFVEPWSNRWLTLFNEASAVNFLTETPEMGCPVYFFVGKRDFQTYYKLTEDYCKMLKAPKKDLFWFDNSSHSLNVTEPEKLQKIILSIIKN